MGLACARPFCRKTLPRPRACVLVRVHVHVYVLVRVYVYVLVRVTLAHSRVTGHIYFHCCCPCRMHTKLHNNGRVRRDAS